MARTVVETMPLSEVRERLSDSLGHGVEHVVLTDNNVTVGVCVSPERYAALEDARRIVEAVSQKLMAESADAFEADLAEMSNEEREGFTRLLEAARREAADAADR